MSELTASYDMHRFRVATELQLCYKWVVSLAHLDFVTMWKVAVLASQQRSAPSLGVAWSTENQYSFTTAALADDYSTTRWNASSGAL
jgi:hypothetical protein